MEVPHMLTFFGAIIAVVLILNWLGASSDSTAPVLMMQSQSPFVFTFYYLTSCGHCRRAKPEWDKFRSSYSGPVQIREVDAELNQEEVRNLGINKFPTFILSNRATGQSTEYDGDRSGDSWTQYLDEIAV